MSSSANKTLTFALLGFAIVCPFFACLPKNTSEAEKDAQGSPVYEDALPLTEDDKVEAVRLILSWLQGKEALPGYSEKYPDSLLSR